jgi:hypothetical protein
MLFSPPLQTINHSGDKAALHHTTLRLTQNDRPQEQPINNEFCLHRTQPATVRENFAQAPSDVNSNKYLLSKTIAKIFVEYQT